MKRYVQSAVRLLIAVALVICMEAHGAQDEGGTEARHDAAAHRRGMQNGTAPANRSEECFGARRCSTTDLLPPPGQAVPDRSDAANRVIALQLADQSRLQLPRTATHDGQPSQAND